MRSLDFYVYTVAAWINTGTDGRSWPQMVSQLATEDTTDGGHREGNNSNCGQYFAQMTMESRLRGWKGKG